MTSRQSSDFFGLSTPNRQSETSQEKELPVIALPTRVEEICLPDYLIFEQMRHVCPEAVTFGRLVDSAQVSDTVLAPNETIV